MKYSINLFPRHKSGVAERTVYFIANYLRYALVMSLLVVIVVFFLRMRLDQELIDEKEKLSLKISIITATKDLQSDLNTAQYKLKSVQSLVASQDLFFAKFDYINTVIPKQSTTTLLSIADTEVVVEGTCKDYRLIQAFIAKLRKDGRFEKVTLANVVRESGYYIYSVELEGFKQTGTKQAKI